MSTTPIPLSKLRLSPRNARDPKEGDLALQVHDLQASIVAHGLMTPLTVHKLRAPRGHYGVVAGGRRLKALQGLQADGKLPRHLAEVDCYVTDVDDSALTEMSIAENMVRVAMRPVEEFEAFAVLANDGADEAAIAERFGTTLRHVQQRMRLGRLHPDILAALDERRISDEHARAYASTADQALQIRVYGEMSAGWQHYPHNIRNAIRGGSAAVDTDRMLRVVGTAAYLDAGGQLEEDFFTDQQRVLQPGTLQDLYYAKLAEQEAALKATLPDHVEISTSGVGLGPAIFPTANLSDEDRDRLLAIDARADEIHEAFDQLAEPDPDAIDFNTDEPPPMKASKPDDQAKVDALRAELCALEDEGEAIHAASTTALPEGPAVAWVEPTATGMQIKGWYRPAGWAPEGAPAAPASKAPAASLDKPIGLDPRIGFGDPKPAVKAETGLTADAIEIMRSHRRAILRGMMVDETGRAWGAAAALLPFVTLRSLLGAQGRSYGIRGNAAAELGIATGAIQTASGPAVTLGRLDELSAQPCARRWGDTLTYLEGADWMTEPDLRRAFALFTVAPERQRDLAGAVAAALLLDRSLSAPGYRVPLHDELALLMDTADQEDVRHQFTPDTAFFERLPKSRRLEAVAEISPAISKEIGKLPTADIAEACALFFTGSDVARRRWKMQPVQVAQAKRWIPAFLAFAPRSDKPRIVDVMAAEKEPA